MSAFAAVGTLLSGGNAGECLMTALFVGFAFFLLGSGPVVFRCFLWKTDDYVGAEGHFPSLSQFGDFFQVPIPGVSPPHRFQDPVRSGLHGQVKVGQTLGRSRMQSTRARLMNRGCEVVKRIRRIPSI